MMYKPQQILIMNETGLMWKMMPECTHIMKEKSAPGFKVFKDRFTLLLGANLTGNCKLKPVMVYHSKNPRALKGYDEQFTCAFERQCNWLDDRLYFPGIQQECPSGQAEGVLHG